MTKEKWNAYMRGWRKRNPTYYNTDARREYMREYMRKRRQQKKDQTTQTEE